MIDEIDKKILNILQNNGRITNSELASKIKMAPSAVFSRIKKLEEKKIIKKYSTIIDENKVGRNLLAFIEVKAKGPIADIKTANEISKIKEVQEVHLVAGEDCFFVKVRVENPEELTKLLRNKFSKIPNIITTKTTIVLETVKETMEIIL